MKKVFLALLLAVGVFSVAFAADEADIPMIKVIPDTANERPILYCMSFEENTATVITREIDANGDKTDRKNRYDFKNIPDDPNTPEDETNNEWNKFKQDHVAEIVASSTAGDNAATAEKKAMRTAFNNAKSARK